MKYIIVLFYIGYFVLGGYRNYTFEYEFFHNVKAIELNTLFVGFVKIAEIALMGLVCFNILNPLKKYGHLTTFILLFILDFVFQNHVRFRASIIIINLTPLLIFLFLHFKEKRKELVYIYVLLISIGYLSAMLNKLSSGWANPKELVVYSYLVQFNLGYHFQQFFSNTFLQIKSIAFWKFADYITLLFQSLFFINFFTKKYFIILCSLACIFHLSILFILNIPVFFPYMIIYSIIIALQFFNFNEAETTKINWGATIIFCSITILISIFYSTQFFTKTLPLFFYEIRDILFNFIALSCFIFTVYQYFKVNKSILFNHD